MKTGMVSVTFRSKSVDEILRLCVDNNLAAVEWSENAHIHPNDAAGALILHEKTVNAGLEIAAYGSYYRIGCNKEPLKVFNASLVSADALCAPIIRVWAGDKPSVGVTPREVAAIAEEAALIAGLAAERGIKVAFEWHKNTLTDTNDSAMNLLKQADHPNLYCLWQPTVELGEEERCRGIELLGARLLNLHVYYWPEGKRRPLAEGEAFWKTYLDHMDRTVERYALLEFVMGDSEEQFSEDAAVLNAWIQKYN